MAVSSWPSLSIQENTTIEQLHGSFDQTLRHFATGADCAVYCLLENRRLFGGAYYDVEIKRIISLGCIE